MNFKKTLVIPAICALSLTGLASCSKNTKQVINFYVPSSTTATALGGIKSTFESQNPGWTLAFTSFDGTGSSAGYAGIASSLKNSIPSSKFDVSLALGYMDTAVELMDSGKVVAFDNYLPDSIKSDLIDTFYQETLINNSHYGLPFVRSTEALYVDETALTSLYAGDGWKTLITTWDGIYQICDKISTLTDNADYKKWYALGVDAASNFFIDGVSTLNGGSGYVDPTGTNTDSIVKFNNDATIKWLEKVQSGSKNMFYTSGYASNLMNAAYSKDNPAQETGCFMAIGSTAGAKYYGKEYINSTFGVYNIPSYNTTASGQEGAYDATRAQGPNILMFKSTKYKDNDKVEMAAKVVNLMLETNFQVEYSTSTGYLPVVSSAKDNQAFIDFTNNGTITAETIKLASERLLNPTIAAQKAIITPAFNGSNAVQNAVADLIKSILTPQIGATEPTDVTEAMKKCIDKIRETLG